ncbi:MAG TPA: hypothetical protein VFS12_16565, partial [Terriglobia bacterium]|nr:hypothetical protein [Terriglobia bacterium]
SPSGRFPVLAFDLVFQGHRVHGFPFSSIIVELSNQEKATPYLERRSTSRLNIDEPVTATATILPQKIE